jgi:hypothetical protein
MHPALTPALLYMHTANVREHDFWGMVRASAALTQQLCAVFIFFVRHALLLLLDAFLLPP